MLWSKALSSPREMGDREGAWTVRNDADYQDWEADRFLEGLRGVVTETEGLDEAKQAWKEWQHLDSRRHGRPFDQYVEDSLKALDDRAAAWEETQEEAISNATTAYLAEHPDQQLGWMHSLRTSESRSEQWRELRQQMDESEVLSQYLESSRGDWSAEKLREYNLHLSGKVMIPQPFAELRNAYEVKSGLGISRYMVIEVLVAIVLLLLFRWLAGRARDGGPPRGKLWNLLESFLAFIKTDIVEKGIEPHESPRFLPLFWTMFLFILGCNLAGMIPGLGSPTAALGLTGILAVVVFAVGSYLGIQKLAWWAT